MAKTTKYDLSLAISNALNGMSIEQMQKVLDVANGIKNERKATPKADNKALVVTATAIPNVALDKKFTFKVLEMSTVAYGSVWNALNNAMKSLGGTWVSAKDLDDKAHKGKTRVGHWTFKTAEECNKALNEQINYANEHGKSLMVEAVRYAKLVDTAEYRSTKARKNK